MASKKEISRQVRQDLSSLTRQMRAAISHKLMALFIASPAYRQSQVLATYLSLPHEWDTSHLIRQAQADGKRLLVPKLLGQGQMIFVDYAAEQLVPTAWGLLEPSSNQAVDKSVIDLIHVPGLVFDPEGYRIGHGGGYYDRYLADYQGLTLATLHSSQLCHFPKEPHDIPVKELLIDDSTQTTL